MNQMMQTQNGENGMTQFKEEAKARQETLVPQTNLNINAAMRYIYDQMESCLIVNYVILGEAGLAIYEGRQVPSDIEVIEVGISHGQMTPEVLSLFKQWGYVANKKGYETTFEGTKIQFIVMKRKYKWMQHVDVRFYDVDEYKIPNPFSEYWKIKQLVA
jgi:hypothetical protein